MASEATDKLLEQATQLLTDLREGLEKGGQFIYEQAPPLMKQIVIQGRIRSTAWMLIGLLLMWAASRVFTKTFPFMEAHRPKSSGDVNEWWDGSEWRAQYIFSTILRSFGGLIGAGMFIGFARTFVLSWFAPSLYVLNCIIDAVGGGGCK